MSKKFPRNLYFNVFDGSVGLSANDASNSMPSTKFNTWRYLAESSLIFWGIWFFKTAYTSLIMTKNSSLLKIVKIKSSKKASFVPLIWIFEVILLNPNLTFLMLTAGENSDPTGYSPN